MLNDNLCTVHEVDINWQKNKMAVASIVQGEKRRAQWNKILDFNSHIVQILTFNSSSWRGCTKPLLTTDVPLTANYW